MGKKITTAKGKRVTTAKEVTEEGNKKRAAELDKKQRGYVVFFLLSLAGDALVASYV